MKQYREEDYPETTAKIPYSIIEYDFDGNIVGARLVEDEFEEVMYFKPNAFDEDGNPIQIKYG